MKEESTHIDEVAKYLRRNFLGHSIEGGLYIGGLAFIARETVLPPLIKDLGGPVWLVSIVPFLDHVGVYLPSIFVVHFLERLRWKMPALMLTGFLQRIPMLLAGLFLFFFSGKLPWLTLMIVAFAPLMSGIFCGVTYPAWVELVAKTIPARRRASLFAIRLIIASVIGFCAGEVIKNVLSSRPGPEGFAILHFCAFGCLALSYIVFSRIKETNLPPKLSERNGTLAASFREIPQLLREDKRFARYLLSIALLNGSFIALPFLSIHALDRLGKPASFLGDLVIAMVAGKFVANFICGYLGDRFGGKIGLAISMVLYMLMFAASIFANSVFGFYAVFFVAGYCRDSGFVCRATMNVDIPPPERRVKYQSILTVAVLPSIIAMPLLGGLVRTVTGSYAPVALLAAVSVFFAFVLLLKIKEPRFG